MKNSFIILMNILFVMVVAADVISVKFDCETNVPIVTKSTYQQIQAQLDTDVKTADLGIAKALKL